MIAERFLVATLSTLLAFPPFALAQLTNLSPDSNSFEGEIANLDRMEKFTRELRASLNREAFDFEAVLDSTDYEAPRIIQLVKQSVAYEAYNGVLRGPPFAQQGSGHLSITRSGVKVRNSPANLLR